MDALVRVGNQNVIRTEIENRALKENQKMLLNTSEKPFGFNENEEISILKLIAKQADIKQHRNL